VFVVEPAVASSDLLTYLSVIPDPRIDRNKKHDLAEMLFVASCAVISGAEGWSDIVEFAESKLDWMHRFVKLDNGIPVDDTFARVLSRISPQALHTCFLSWTQALNVNSDGLIIAIDGKTVRRSHNRREGRSALHLVRAWATEAGIALGQVATEVKSNEITAIPELLRQLELKGAIVTIDALGCQRAIAEQITAQKGDYVLALKGNQTSLNDAVRDYFMTAKAHDFQGVDFTYHEQLNTGHGRIEQRRCWACADLSTLPETKPWAGLSSIIMVESERHVDDKVTTEQRFFISSLKSNADKIAPAIRAHWEIENGCHWVLDVTFGEDNSRIRRGHGAHNFSTLRQMALTVLKRESTKISIRKKRIRAGFNDLFREQVLASARI
jgi:predicted transposase YbfD/YdcC